ncbi:OmpA family protein [Tenacibaculum agarivorans]|uniref:OmpA family protein n=1 Tax=Tenacibaculum agarivorans TaxID=1908389 RepID=UPI00094B8F67|nr:OmpA family protein [Tenacibaculum agarivorans]
MKSKVVFSIALFFTITFYGQKRVAEIFYKTYSYNKAAELYRVVLKRGDTSISVLTRLGDCYYNNSNAKEALYWYKLASKNEKEFTDEYIYKYVQVLRSIGKYKEADTWFLKLKRKFRNYDQTNYYNELKELNKNTIKIQNLNVNTKYSDFGGFVYNNRFYFASAMNEKREKYDWNDQPYLDLYEAKLIKDEEYISVDNTIPIVSSKVNTDFHESSIAMTKDGKTLYFTRNNLTKRKKLDYDKQGTSNLKIFKATLINGVWDAIEELPFNDEVYSTGHPALSPDEKTLYFTSNKPGGFGLTDLYKVTIYEDGTYGKPENLGKHINTEKREMFPFIAKDSTLYFSSDGYKNLGLLDIFKSNFLKDSLAEVTNIGAPFNSGDDDFSFFIDSDNKTGYFSSNREGGKGEDDIYGFTTIEQKQFIRGQTFDIRTKEILPNTLVYLIGSRGKVIDSLKTKKDAKYEFEVEYNQKYVVKASKKNYKGALETVYTNTKEDIEQDLYLTPLIVNEEIVVNPIFFDFNKWNIRPDAAYELEKVVDVLRNNPKMIIKIEAHTDSRGNDAYNMRLSNKRVKSTRDYILSRNIQTHRIVSAIGYGESMLINKCVNNVECTEEEHQENRRSKFIILSR